MDLEQIKNSKSDYDFLYQLLLKKGKHLLKMYQVWALFN